MEIFILSFLLVVVMWCVIGLFRIEIVHRHLRRRINEVFSLSDWYKYDIDIYDAYNRAMWDYRKWTYKQFFPEDVK